MSSCQHDWVDVSLHGESTKREMCVACGAQRAFAHVHGPGGYTRRIGGVIVICYACGAAVDAGASHCDCGQEVHHR